MCARLNTKPSTQLRDRKHLAEDGVMIIVATIDRESGNVLAGPDIVSRGFVYVRESEELMDDAKQLMKQAEEETKRLYGILEQKYGKTDTYTESYAPAGSGVTQ